MFSKATFPDQRLARYDHLIVHVTATKPNQDFDDKDIDKMHRARGFRMCGYQAVIKRDGTWLDSDMGAVTRPIGDSGAHVGGCGEGWNGRSFGVSLVGGVDKSKNPDFNMTPEQMNTLKQGINRFLDLHPAGRASVTVMGHRDLIKQTNASPKACPCFDVIPWWAAQSVDEDADPISPPPPSPVDLPEVWKVRKGDTLGKIASVSGVDIPRIMALNPEIVSADLITVGQVIRLR